jgi:His-Xaa-Ser repeat protein HxsA
MSRAFVIASLLAAGFGSRDVLAADVFRATTGSDDRSNRTTLFETFRQDHEVTLADHRSHRSHSSHSSHRSGSGGHYSHSSHRSSTGGYGNYSPAPVYTPPPTATSSADTASSRTQGSSDVSSVYSSPDAVSATTSQAPLKALSGRSELFKSIVKRVQIGLLAHGLFNATIDGNVGPATRKALRAYQSKFGLAQTGTITPETLDSLKIPSSAE